MSIRFFKTGLLSAMCLATGMIVPAFGLAQAGNPGTDLLVRPAAMQERAATSVLLDITVAGARVVAIGERGIVLLSDDLGKTWRQARVPVSVALTKLHFPTPERGWAVGHAGVVLHSSDGGATWVKQLDGLRAAQVELESAKAAAAQAGNDGVRRVRDAERLVAEGADKPFLDVHFSDADRGIVIGAYGMAFVTQDGGKTWQSIKGRLNDSKGRHLYSILATGKGLYFAGEQGALYHSDDEGRHFREIVTPYVGTYFGIIDGRNGELIAFGLRGNAYRSTDSGASWSKINTGLPVTLTAGRRLGSGALVLTDETGRVLLSQDNGASFAPIAVVNPSAFTGVVQVSDGSLVMSGVRGPARIAAENVQEGSRK